MFMSAGTPHARFGEPMTRASGGIVPNSDNVFTPAAVRGALARVLASSHFNGSARKSKFLTYIVDQMLAGNGDRLTAYDVAIAVFDRDERFDPRSDPLVRITARRVRAALEQYYLTSGRDDPLRITLPKGRYSPVFEARTLAPPSHPAAPPSRAGRMRARAQAVAATVLLIGAAGVLYGVTLSPEHHPDRAAAPATARERVTVAVRNLSGNALWDKSVEQMTREIEQSLCCTPRLEVVPRGSAADLALDALIQEDASGMRAQIYIATPAGQVLWTHAYTVGDHPGQSLADAAVTDSIKHALTQLRPAHP